MTIEPYRPAPPALPARPPIGRYVLVGTGVLAAATWSMAVLVVLVLVLAVGAISVSICAAVLKGMVGPQKR